MTNSSENNTQENQLDMSKIWSYIRCYFYVIFGYHFLFLVEESTGEKFYNVWSGYFIITSILLMLVLYFCKEESVNSILSFCKDKLKYIYSIILFVFLIIYISNVCSIRDFLDDFFKAINFLELNDLGDFLSGVFAPLAFVFLYLSYKQLQQQLKISNDTLDEQKKQAEEQLKIANQTLEEQKKQVEILTYPFFIFEEIEKDSYDLVNLGEVVNEVRLYSKNNYYEDLDINIGVMEKDQKYSLDRNLIYFVAKNRFGDNASCNDFYLTLSFKNKLYGCYEQNIHLTINEKVLRDDDDEIPEIYIETLSIAEPTKV